MSHPLIIIALVFAASFPCLSQVLLHHTKVSKQMDHHRHQDVNCRQSSLQRTGLSCEYGSQSNAVTI